MRNVIVFQRHHNLQNFTMQHYYQQAILVGCRPLNCTFVIENYQCWDTDLRKLRDTMPSLASFSMIEGLKELMHLSTLISHDLSFSEITDEKLKELGNLSTLTSPRPTGTRRA